jgi:hypothetical protein
LPELADGLAWNTTDLYTTGMISVGQPGNYNDDGIVDAADYVAWRKTDGSPAGYDIWRTQFGELDGSGALSGATVPEPTGAAILIFAAAIAARLRCGTRLRAIPRLTDFHQVRKGDIAVITHYATTD